jgi:phosphate transport system substrate-binding protein
LSFAGRAANNQLTAVNHFKRGNIMTKRTSIMLGAAAVALAAGTAGATPTTALYAGGSTLVEKVYRDTFDAYGSTASGDLCFGLSTVCPTTHYNSGVEILYVGVGSGNGLKALETNNPLNYVAGPKTPDAVPVAASRDFNPFYGTGFGSTWVPDTTGTGPAYPKVSFSGSDNTLGSSDITAAAAAPPNGLGNNPLIQVPGIIAAIAVPFQPAAHWLPKGGAVTGGSSKVQLSTNTLCGIFTGRITLWNSPAITKDNGGTRLGTGPITVVYRHDSSGTTFLFSNALVNQCGVTAAPGVKAFSTPHSTNPVPGKWLVDNESPAGTAPTYNANAPHYKTGTSFFINVFNAGHLPKNFINNKTLTGVTGGANGSGGVQKAILATTGSIGYVSPDFVQPVDKTGPQAANLQTYASFSAGGTAVYKAPTAINAIPIMSSSKPPTFPVAAANPLNWGAIDPLPASAAAYPIGGFSFIDLRRCYTSAADVAALAGTTAGHLGYLTWYFGTSSVNQGKPAAILKQDGFAQVPTAWSLSIIRLLTAPLTGLNVVGTGSCKTVKHGA